MLFPEELFVKEILPSFRIVLAKTLQSKGYSQQKISKLLGVTQARVNSYIKEDIKFHLAKLEEIGFNTNEIISLINGIAEDKGIDTIFVLRVLRSFFLSYLQNGSLCKYHMKVSGLSPICDVCIKQKEASEVNERIKMVREIKEAVQRLTQSKEFYMLVPEVFTNLVYSLPNAESIDDVLSFPGRLVKIKNSIKAISEPEFGVSKHMASILIEAHRRNRKIRACLCIKYDENILHTIRKLNLIYDFNYEKKGGKDPVLEAFKEFLKEKEVPQILVDEGGKGIEPVCYIFGENPSNVVETVLKISKNYFEEFVVS